MGIGERSIRVLHVDDDPSFVELAAEFVERAADDLTVVTETSAAAALDRLDAEWIDCIVSDYEMPEMDGLELLGAVREEYPDLPFILFTGRGSEEIASEAVSAGVTDYLQKGTDPDRFTVLANRIENAVAQYRAERDLKGRLDQQEVVADLSRAALRTTDLGGLFDRAVTAVGSVLDLDRVAVLECRPDGYDGDERLSLRGGLGWTDEEVGSATVPVDASTDAGYTVTSGNRVVTSDFTDESRFDAAALTPEPVTYSVCVVVGDPGDPWGVLLVHAREEIRITTDDVNFLRSVANVLASATERLERERASERTQRTLRQVVDLVPHFVFAKDIEGRFLLANERAAAAYGTTPEAIEGRTATELGAPPEEAATWREHNRRVVESGEPTRVRHDRMTTADGDRLVLDTRLIPFDPPDTDEPAVLGISVDVTERRERERELARYETIVETMDDGAWVLDADGRFTFVNRKLAATLGVSPEEIEGVHVRDLFEEYSLFDPDTIEEVAEGIEALLAGEREEVRCEATLSLADGEAVRDVRVLPVTVDGEIEGAVGVNRDVTERVERERELKRRNERLEEFASVVSHDLRNPLSVAVTCVELLEEGMVDPPDEHTARLSRSLDRMEAIIQDLLTLASAGEAVSEREAVAAGDVASAAWRTVETADATLEVAETGTIVADRGRLRQLFENLFRNAVEHGGEDVTVRVVPIDADDDTDGGSQPGRRGFAVADDGPGIPPGERDRVLESGYSTAQEGTGFGLAIVAEIAEAHGWSLRVTEGRELEWATVRSDGGSGACFEFTGVEFVD